MKERKSRLKTIQSLIGSNKIESQDQLLNMLDKAGINITQATLSRDLKELKVGKVPDNSGGYYYVLQGNDSGTESQLKRDFQRGFLSINFSGNLCVVHTLPGHANPVAAALDSLGLTEIIGTIAGDDTILLILQESVKRDELVKKLEATVGTVGTVKSSC